MTRKSTPAVLALMFTGIVMGQPTPSRGLVGISASCPEPDNIPDFGGPAIAQLWTIEIPSFDDLSAYPLVITEFPAPYSSEDFFDNHSTVGAETHGTLTLRYTDSQGSHEIVEQIVIDNITGDVTHGGQLVSTLADVFSLSPLVAVQYDPLLAAEFDQPVTVTTQPAKSQPAEKGYKTDKGNTVPTSKSSPEPPITQQEAEQAIAHEGLTNKVEQTGPVSNDSNCHGHTFTNDERWINDPKAVDKILDDNNYKPTLNNKGKPGDVVVYRDESGTITHTGVVTQTESDGTITKVESKFGQAGTYSHGPWDVPNSYNPPSWTVYHSNRSGGNKLVSSY